MLGRTRVLFETIRFCSIGIDNGRVIQQTVHAI